MEHAIFTPIRTFIVVAAVLAAVIACGTGDFAVYYDLEVDFDALLAPSMLWLALKLTVSYFLDQIRSRVAPCTPSASSGCSDSF